MTDDNETDKRPPLPMFGRARELRRQATPAEVRLWSVLRNRGCGGLRFLRQAPAGHYVLDFYCPALRVALEVDGAVHDGEEAAARDAERATVLAELFHITVIHMRNAVALAGSDDDLRKRILATLDGSRSDGVERTARIVR